jgi:hypothetical protein
VVVQATDLIGHVLHHATRHHHIDTVVLDRDRGQVTVVQFQPLGRRRELDQVHTDQAARLVPVLFQDWRSPAAPRIEQRVLGQQMAFHFALEGSVRMFLAEVLLFQPLRQRGHRLSLSARPLPHRSFKAAVATAALMPGRYARS